MAKSSKYYETAAFKRLNSSWAKKLEKSGFKDVEQPASFESGAPDGNLKQWSSWLSEPSKLDPAKYAAKEEYYRLAGQFLYEHEFSCDEQMWLWQLHSEGGTTPGIVKAFKAKGITHMMRRKINIRYVHETTKKIADLMLKKLKNG